MMKSERRKKRGVEWRETEKKRASHKGVSRNFPHRTKVNSVALLFSPVFSYSQAQKRRKDRKSERKRASGHYYCWLFRLDSNRTSAHSPTFVIPLVTFSGFAHYLRAFHVATEVSLEPNSREQPSFISDLIMISANLPGRSVTNGLGRPWNCRNGTK